MKSGKPQWSERKRGGERKKEGVTAQCKNTKTNLKEDIFFNEKETNEN